MNQIVGDFREEPEARHDDVVRHDTRIALVQSLKQEYAASLRAVGSGAEWDRVPLLVSMHAPSRAAGKGVARVSPTDDRHQIGIGRLSQVRSLAVGRFRPQPRMSRNAHAFTLTEILVSLAIIAVLIGILLPSLAMVRKTSQKVVCASNLRQSGLGLHMYATDNADFLPLSSFAMGNGADFDTSPLQLRIEADLRGFSDGPDHWWDGLGFLYEQRYLSDGRIFYCPSHVGENTFEAFADRFAGEAGDILANYQYRGRGPRGEEKLDQFDANAALVSDGFRDLSEINHQNGMNVLRAAMSVNWFRDEGLANMSNAIMSGAGDEFDWEDRWRLLDEPELGGGFWPWD